jgi:hypothetical protein
MVCEDDGIGMPADAKEKFSPGSISRIPDGHCS